MGLVLHLTLISVFQACIDDNVDMVTFLVEHGANINQPDNEGWIPLHAAASCGYLDIAEWVSKNQYQSLDLLHPVLLLHFKDICHKCPTIHDRTKTWEHSHLSIYFSANLSVVIKKFLPGFIKNIIMYCDNFEAKSVGLLSDLCWAVCVKMSHASAPHFHNLSLINCSIVFPCEIVP